jgi:dTDP-4-amino-4,6-dideoxygalactose transaminase
VEFVAQCSSGTAALVAALMGLQIGPGDEVIVPAVTYMATASAVLVAGAIPVIVDVDDSLTLDPKALDSAVGPRTRAVVPVHMWGLPADMDRIIEVARRHQLLVLEDACQAVGGAYEGRRLGGLGAAGAFSFNFFKNMSCGEGGAVCTNDRLVFDRARCAIDCCNFYWNGEPQGFRGFAGNASRASEFEGALLNVQLGRLPEMISTMRAHKHRVMAATRDRLVTAPSRSPEHECGTHLVYQFESPARAARFAEQIEGQVASETGRHIYTRWTPVLEHNGAHHPALNPFNLPANAECRKSYSVEMCQRSVDIASRSVLIAMHPDRSETDLDMLVDKLRAAAESS